jgi:hypothetical protein
MVKNLARVFLYQLSVAYLGTTSLDVGKLGKTV